MSEVTSANVSTGNLFRNRWFWWKESRQLLPLVFALSAIAILMVIGHAFASHYISWMQVRGELPLLVIPGLFATGAGAVMVGHEREQGTMRWLSTLPITPKALVLQKFALAAVGLLIMWVVAFVLIGLSGNASLPLVKERGTFNASGWQAASRHSMGYPGLITYTFMVLAAGFYSSWRIKNQFNSLLLLIGCASVPIFAVELCSQLSGNFWRIMVAKELSFLWFVFSVLLTILFSILGYRHGIRALSAAPAPRVLKPSGEALSAYESPRGVAAMPKFGTQIAPIIWQTWRSSRFVVLGLFALLAYSSFHLVYFHSLDQNDLFVALFPVAGLFAVSWLAVVIFKNDGGFTKVRFFADRGISAGTVFWGRHLVSISLCALAMLIYIAAIMNTTEEGISPLAIGLFVFLIYSISQWVSQLFRMVSVAVIVAPVVSGMVIGWWVISVIDFDAPIWLLALLGLVPMVVTRCMMARYMDGRDRPSSYVVAAIMVLVLVLVPLAPAVLTVLSAKRMDPIKRAKLIAEVDGEIYRNGQELDYEYSFLSQWINESRVGAPVDDVVPESNIDPPENQPQQISEIKPWHRWGDLQKVPSDVALNAIGTSITVDFNLQRLLAESASDNPLEGIESLRPWMLSIARAVRGLRQSNRIADQESADVLEIHLLDALKSELLQNAKDQAFYREVLGCLPSIDQRRKGRRKALLVSWRRWLRVQADPEKHTRKDMMGVTNYKPKYEMAGYRFYREYTLHAPKIADAIQGAYIDRLIEILLDATGGTIPENTWTSQLHEHLFGTSGFATGPYGPRYRNFPAIDSVRRHDLFPALFWGMQWETEIEKLRPGSIANVKKEASHD